MSKQSEIGTYETKTRQRKTEAAEQMQAFMRRQPRIQGVDIKALIEEGRT